MMGRGLLLPLRTKRKTSLAKGGQLFGHRATDQYQGNSTCVILEQGRNAGYLRSMLRLSVSRRGNHEGMLAKRTLIRLAPIRRGKRPVGIVQLNWLRRIGVSAPGFA
jgi:hypothetical protein